MAESKIVNEFKEHKKVMAIKMEQAKKMADDAAEEFVNSVKSLVASASVEDIKALLETADDDNFVDEMDKVAIMAMYAESHDDVGSVVIINRKQ